MSEEQVVDITDPEKVEKDLVTQCLNDLNKSYKEVLNSLTKLSSTSVRRVLAGVVSYPLDTKVLSKIQEREDEYALFVNARACITTAGYIDHHYSKKHEVQKEVVDNAAPIVKEQLEQLNQEKEGEVNVSREENV